MKIAFKYETNCAVYSYINELHIMSVNYICRQEPTTALCYIYLNRENNLHANYLTLEIAREKNTPRKYPRLQYFLYMKYTVQFNIHLIYYFF